VISNKNDDPNRDNEFDFSMEVNVALTKPEVITRLRWLVGLLETGPDDLGEWHEWINGQSGSSCSRRN